MLKRSIILAVSQILSQGAIAILYIVVARESGAASFGGVVAAIALANFLAGIVDFGTNSLWVRGLVTNALSHDKLTARMSSKLIIAAGVGGVVAALSAILLSETFYYLSGLLTVSVAFFQCAIVSIKAAGAGTRLSVAILLERLLAIFWFFILLWVGLDAHIALVLALSIGSFSAGIAAYCTSPIKFIKVSSLVRLAWPWKGATSYGLGGMAIAAQSLDAAILHTVAGPSATGIFGAVNRWTQPMGVFANAFATTGLPVVARTQSLRRSYGEMRRAWWILAMGMATCLLVAIFASQLVDILLGPQYEGSASVLFLLALGTIPSLLNQPLYAFLQALHANKHVATVACTSVAIQLTLCFILGLLYQETGIAAAFMIAQFCFLTGFIIILVWRSKTYPPPSSQF
ncbi:oligosaccharide flippase family protein [Kocuria sp. CPCC 205258]|uniref:oligosaccharide flippase family protein n=1 Tax=Kocuria sp. CPCC 205258 TaxID=3073552 RepID=UPI0034D7409B